MTLTEMYARKQILHEFPSINWRDSFRFELKHYTLAAHRAISGRIKILTRNVSISLILRRNQKSNASNWLRTRDGAAISFSLTSVYVFHNTFLIFFGVLVSSLRSQVVRTQLNCDCEPTHTAATHTLLRGELFSNAYSDRAFDCVVTETTSKFE